MAKKSESLLIIFYKNPRLGKVKTRLAATVGDAKALEVFRALADHTCSVTKSLECDRAVYYSDEIELGDLWSPETFMKHVQQGDDLGERMKNAFLDDFKKEYTSVCIIGTDCAELTSDIIRQGFQCLRTADAVIGPAQDGGYYLLGMKEMFPAVFENKRWSTQSVLADTMRDFESAGLMAVRLPVLRDVDTSEDLPKYLS
jgi:rSAM/selenodomain-associated transferase 1